MSKVRLLLVDKNEETQKSVGEIVSTLGFDFDAAGTGPDALKLIRDNDYAMIFIDTATPEGLPAIQRMRDEGIEIMTVGYSANAGPEEASRCREFSVNQFLPQALDQEVLEKLLRRWITTENWLD